MRHIAFFTQPPAEIRWGVHATPCGRMGIGLTTKNEIALLLFGGSLKKAQRLWPKTRFVSDQRVTKKVANALFSGRQKTKIKIRLTGTPFQIQVWKALVKVPAGQTISYGELASRIGKPLAARAVGRAMGANPVPILVPCHRVVAQGGRAGGYAGGLEIKRFLLESEGVLHPFWGRK